MELLNSVFIHSLFLFLELRPEFYTAVKTLAGQILKEASALTNTAKSGPELMELFTNGIKAMAAKTNLKLNRSSFEFYAFEKFKKEEEIFFEEASASLEIIFYNDLLCSNSIGVLKNHMIGTIRDYLTNLEYRMAQAQCNQSDIRTMKREKEIFFRSKFDKYSTIKTNLDRELKSLVINHLEKPCIDHLNDNKFIDSENLSFIANKGEDTFKAKFISKFGDHMLNYINIDTLYLRRLSRVLDINEFFRRNQFLYSVKNFFRNGKIFFLSIFDQNPVKNEMERAFENISNFNDSIEPLLFINDILIICEQYKYTNSIIWQNFPKQEYKVIFEQFFLSIMKKLRGIQNRSIIATFNECLDETVLNLICSCNKFEFNNLNNHCSLLIQLKTEHNLTNFNFKHSRDFQELAEFSISNRNSKRKEFFEKELNATRFLLTSTLYLDEQRKILFKTESFSVGRYF